MQSVEEIQRLLAEAQQVAPSASSSALNSLADAVEQELDGVPYERPSGDINGLSLPEGFSFVSMSCESAEHPDQPQ